MNVHILTDDQRARARARVLEQSSPVSGSVRRGHLISANQLHRCSVIRASTSPTVIMMAVEARSQLVVRRLLLDAADTSAGCIARFSRGKDSTISNTLPSMRGAMYDDMAVDVRPPFLLS